ncbi:MAG: IclR family transcriptional regulator [Saprospiraceae bacterium]|nr:IclR family transcriptional regulator [Bacteroidia bacterium]NNE15639.1 IclR family transcriptional regulator [Saprospiraceae bacterium]NNL90638.1 IclR family transcriptional regulator [Saprospiraceae bacterium]
MKTSSLSTSGLNGSIIKAFKLLEFFSPLKPSWGVRELARHIGANESTTYRMMSTLERLGILYKNPISEKYALGLKLYELGNRVDINDSFVHLTHPELEKVATEIEETVHLGILKDSSVLMVDKVESLKGLRLDSTVGQMSPLHCTGLGKVLLAFSNMPLRKKLMSDYDFDVYTENTKKTIPSMTTELNKIKKNGFAIDRQEFELGLICVAVPVFNQENKLVAALSAAGPSDRFKENSLNEYVEILKRGANNIKSKIGNYKI